MDSKSSDTRTSFERKIDLFHDSKSINVPWSIQALPHQTHPIHIPSNETIILHPSKPPIPTSTPPPHSPPRPSPLPFSPLLRAHTISHMLYNNQNTPPLSSQQQQLHHSHHLNHPLLPLVIGNKTLSNTELWHR